MVVNRISVDRELLRGRGGFTLIEIVFALVILSISLAAIFSTFYSQHKSYVVQNAVAQMQQNVRGGMLYIEDDLRNVASNPDLPALNIPMAVFGGSYDIPIVSCIGLHDGGTNGPDSIFIISTLEGQTTVSPIPGESIGSASTPVDSVEGWQNGDIALFYNDTSAQLIWIHEVQTPTRLNHNEFVPPSPYFGNNLLGNNFSTGTTRVARIRLSGYYINNSNPDHPRLVRTYFDNNYSLTANLWDIVADDIEDMQVLLGGVFDNTSGFEERDGSFFTGVNASKLANVRQIRIQLVGRTASPDPAWNEGPYYSARYNRTGGITGYDRHRRRPIETVIYLRNWRPTP